MRKNSYGIILEGEPKEQHLNTVPKSYLNVNRTNLDTVP